MNRRLRMNDHVDPRVINAKEPVRLDHLEAFVDQGGGIYRNSLAHAPVRMRQGLFGSGLSHLRDRRPPEGTPGGGQDQPPYLALPSSTQALVDSIVLAIHRQ